MPGNARECKVILLIKCRVILLIKCRVILFIKCQFFNNKKLAFLVNIIGFLHDLYRFLHLI